RNSSNSASTACGPEIARATAQDFCELTLQGPGSISWTALFVQRGISLLLWRREFVKQPMVCWASDSRRHQVQRIAPAEFSLAIAYKRPRTTRSASLVEQFAIMRQHSQYLFLTHYFDWRANQTTD